MTGSRTSPAQTSTVTVPRPACPVLHRRHADGGPPAAGDRSRRRHRCPAPPRSARRPAQGVPGPPAPRPTRRPGDRRHGGPGDVDLFDDHVRAPPGAAVARSSPRSGRAGRPADPHHPRTVGPQPEGEGRSLRPVAHHVLAAPEHPDRALPARWPGPGPAATTGLRRFPPKAPPLASGDAGSPSGRHQLASGSRYAGSTQVVCSVSAQSPSGTATGWTSGTVLLRPAPSPRPPGPRPDSAAEPVSPLRAAPGTRPGRRSSAKPPPPRTTSGPELWEVGPSSWARHGPAAGRGPDRVARACPALARPESVAASRPRAAQAASTMDCHPVHRHRWASRADSTAGACDGPVPRARARPGAAGCPGCRTRTGWPRRSAKAPAQRVPSSGSSPSTVVTERPATRRTGVTQATRGGTVHPDGAAAALALGAAAVLDRTAPQLLAERVEERGPVHRHQTDDGGRPLRREGDGGRRGGVAQLKEEPQPQVRVALGFTMWNPAPCSPSL